MHSATHYLSTWLLLASLCLSLHRAVAEVDDNEPVLESTHLEVLRSDNGVLTLRMRADQFVEYANGDRLYPAGIYVEFYDAQTQKITGTLTASRVTYTAEQRIYTLSGDVSIKNGQGNKQVHTEELYWNPDTEDIYTSQPVSIETAEERLEGHGLRAKQDLSHYTVLDPAGFVSVVSPAS